MNKFLSSAFSLCLIPFFALTLSAQDTSSQSNVDWTNNTFSSVIELDIKKSNIQIPSGRSAAKQIITTKIPELLKDPVLALTVDSSKHLGDVVLQETISLDQITNLG